jgi:hypothetical protein
VLPLRLIVASVEDETHRLLRSDVFEPPGAT